MLNQILKMFIATGVLVVTMMSSSVYAGISLGATRLVYMLDSKQATMPVINVSQDKRFLINSWVDDEKLKKVESMLVTPPMFVSEAKGENALRIMNINTALPQDRESIYYLNVQAIPSVQSKDVENKNILQLAILTRIKIFMRPSKLAVRVEDAPNMITATQVNQKLYLKNPSPYYVTLVNIKIDGKEVDNVMLPPFSNIEQKQNGQSISYQTINDYGAFSAVRQLKVQP